VLPKLKPTYPRKTKKQMEFM